MPPGEAYPSVKIHTGLDKVRAVVHDPVIKSLRSQIAWSFYEDTSFCKWLVLWTLLEKCSPEFVFH